MSTFDFGYGPVPAHRHANVGGWVADTANVDASAYVGPEARVSGTARVSEHRHLLTLGPVGSEYQHATFTPSQDGGNVLTVGCWTGDLDGLAAEVKRRAPGFAEEYAVVEQFCRLRLAEWKAAS